MKKIMFILLATCIGSNLMAQNDKGREPFLTKSLSGQSVKNVEAETSGGNISVQSVSGGEARVEVFIWPSNRNKGTTLSKAEIQERLDELYDLSHRTTLLHVAHA